MSYSSEQGQSEGNELSTEYLEGELAKEFYELTKQIPGLDANAEKPEVLNTLTQNRAVVVASLASLRMQKEAIRQTEIAQESSDKWASAANTIAITVAVVEGLDLFIDFIKWLANYVRH